MFETKDDVLTYFREQNIVQVAPNSFYRQGGSFTYEDEEGETIKVRYPSGYLRIMRHMSGFYWIDVAEETE